MAPKEMTVTDELREHLIEYLGPKKVPFQRLETGRVEVLGGATFSRHSMTSVSDATGIDRGRLSRLIRGQVRFSNSEFDSLCKLLGLSLRKVKR